MSTKASRYVQDATRIAEEELQIIRNLKIDENICISY